MTSDDKLPAAESRFDRGTPLPLESPAKQFEPAKDRRPHVPQPPPVNLVAVEDVRLCALSDLNSALDAFYVDLLGFEPDDSRTSAGCRCYRAENFRLWIDLFREHFARISLRPLGVIVQSMPVLEAKLREREIPYTRQRSLVPGRENLLLQDPAGNWLEIDQVRLV